MFENIVVIDLETSGLDFVEHGVLSIGAVKLTDLSKTFYAECQLSPGKGYTNEALGVNGFTTEQIYDSKKPWDWEIRDSFVEWCNNEKLNFIAGHNPIMERFFLENMLGAKQPWHFSHRVLDLHSVYFGEVYRSLNMKAICEELKVTPEPKPHNGLQGALAEAKCFRKLFLLD